MVFSVLLMCAGSLMIGLLPTYETIGVLAPVLLLVARLAQGLSVGGEYGTAATYMSEIAGRGRRGFLSSFQYVTLIGGQLLAVLVVFALQHVLTAEEMRGWGWRIPFLIGAAAAVVAMMLRGSLKESASHAAMTSKEAGSLRALMQHKRALLITLAFTMGGSLYFYTMTTYMQKFLVNTVKLDLKTVSTVMTLALVVFMLLQPVFGALSDRIGRRNNMILFSGLAMLGAVPLLSSLSLATNPWAAFGLILTGLVIATFYTSISGVVKAELSRPRCGRSASACPTPSPTRCSAARRNTSRCRSRPTATRACSSGTSPPWRRSPSPPRCGCPIPASTATSTATAGWATDPDTAGPRNGARQRSREQGSGIPRPSQPRPPA